MKNLHQLKVQPLKLFATILSKTALILTISFIPGTVLAEPPATVASCDGIKDAYPILGKKCKTHYGKIDHNPNTVKKRYDTFMARKNVMIIFRQASICNGYFGASKSDQQKFRSEENDHLTAITNLHTNMNNLNDPNIPNAFTINDLKSVKIKKKQCK